MSIDGRYLTCFDNLYSPAVRGRMEKRQQTQSEQEQPARRVPEHDLERPPQSKHLETVPLEVVLYILRCVLGTGKDKTRQIINESSLRALRCTCRHLHDIATPLVFAQLRYMDTNRLTASSKCLGSILQRPFAEFVRKLEVHVQLLLQPAATSDSTSNNPVRSYLSKLTRLEELVLHDKSSKRRCWKNGVARQNTIYTAHVVDAVNEILAASSKTLKRLSFLNYRTCYLPNLELPLDQESRSKTSLAGLTHFALTLKPRKHISEYGSSLGCDEHVHSLLLSAKNITHLRLELDEFITGADLWPGLFFPNLFKLHTARIDAIEATDSAFMILHGNTLKHRIVEESFFVGRSADWSKRLMESSIRFESFIVKNTALTDLDPGEADEHLTWFDFFCLCPLKVYEMHLTKRDYYTPTLQSHLDFMKWPPCIERIKLRACGLQLDHLRDRVMREYPNAAVHVEMLEEWDDSDESEKDI